MLDEVLLNYKESKMPQGWGEWGAAVSILTVPALILLIYQIYLQRREHMHVSVTLLYSYIDTPDFRKAASFVYNNKPELFTQDKLTDKKLTQEQYEYAESVANIFDRVGFMVKKGQMDEDDVYYQYGYPVLKSTQQLQIFLEDQRDRRYKTGEKRKYDPDFDWLAQRFKMRQLKENGIKIDKSIRKLSLSELLKIEPISIDKFRLKNMDTATIKRNTNT